jgi:acyl-homoserine-lactone acylase
VVRHLPADARPGAFPAYFAPRSLAGAAAAVDPPPAGRRPDLARGDDPPRKHSTEMELAVRLVPELVAAARGRLGRGARRGGGAGAVGPDAPTRRAAAASSSRRGWRRTRAAPPAGRVFATPWSPGGPAGHAARAGDPAAAVAALEAAAAATRERWGAPTSPGARCTACAATGWTSRPTAAPGQLRRLPDVSYVEAPDGRRVPEPRRLVRGRDRVLRSRARAGADRLRERVAARLAAPHRPAGWFARKELRPVWRTRAEVEANLSAREVF